MHFLIAPDKFKDALSARQAAEALQEGILAAFPSATITLLPLADGGEGTAAILTHLHKGNWMETEVRGPSGKKITARWGFAPQQKEAYLELASASGLQLLSSEKRNPLYTSTYGTGELIAVTLEAGAQSIILGLGGSATNDGGAGMAAALGFRFLDRKGQPIQHPNGMRLKDIHHIDSSHTNPLLKSCTITAACDIQHPLLGPSGATYTFASQKGAKAEDLLLLEAGMENLASVVERDLGKSIRSFAGGGAAGGTGAGAFAFLNAELESGAELILQSSGFKQQLQQTDWLITGEGQFDDTSLQGKITGRVCELANSRNIPTLVFCGNSSIREKESYPLGVKEIIVISAQEKSLSAALLQTEKNLKQAAYKYFTSKK
ncbi:glycerate kinase family protein [Nafulsella turpanensis]|uniref:glycerate kinase family protein n=1 Tax=Nafulsella turpanensis TaxID=1265690 RepID=UPI000348E4EB|nr:glycerate kinase [Nafulsella turpanensis]